MKRKILTFVLSFALLLCLGVTAFAFEVPSEYDFEGSEYGLYFETTHEQGCICGQVLSGELNHYEAGYIDGFGAGLSSDGVSDFEKQQIIEDYLASEEFEAFKQQIIADYKESAAAKAEKQEAIDEAIEDYKNSAEYHAAMLNSYTSGMEAGESEFKSSEEYESKLEEQYSNGLNTGYDSAYQKAYDEAVATVYDKGVADGYSNFRSTAEYKNTLQAQFDGGYNEGYTDGSNEALEGVNTDEEGADWTSLISLMATVGFGLVVLVFLLTRKKKKR